MKVKQNGKWHRMSVRACTGYKAEKIKLDGDDLKVLADMPNDQLAATVRQLSGRVNRVKLYPHQKSILETLMDGKGFHSGGIVSTPTGRRPGWPEMQFIRPKGRVVWPVAEPNEVKVSFEKPSGMGKSESLVGADFADIEKRVMAQMAVTPEDMQRDAESPGRFYTAEAQARQHGKTLRHAQAAFDAQLRELTRAVLKAVVDAAWQSVQNQIDEEGCGAAFAAMKEWKE